ncbi:MAG: gamma-glutamyl-gamma-aminobutyrate hydrolase family protein, partial [Bradymonadaceae bacterium]
HRSAEVYEYNRHEIFIAPGSHLQRLYGGLHVGMIPSVHHQAVKALAPGFVVEARSVVDDVIEAIRLVTDGENERYVVGVQWHPEFQDPEDASLLDTRPLFADFLEAVRSRMQKYAR